MGYDTIIRLSPGRGTILAILISVAACTVYPSCLELTWTAPGDDGYIGRASVYELRYSDNVLTVDNWDSATKVTLPIRPREAGSREFFTVSGLEGGKDYWFAIRAADDAGNWSQMSNVVVKRAPLDECVGLAGNVDGDEYDIVDIADLTALITFLFYDEGIICHEKEANVNQDPEGLIDIADLTTLITHLFRLPSTDLPLCQ
ncbi:MAG: hypothetical protein JSU65_09640 [Candidatus Zixiibacteriota bacterium]|nr:MAG: hypothetical protein JSU65_09640 [candidate division Zixibacteria bacterium]